MGTDKLVWIDTETFGLDPVNDYILELGFVITDLELNTVAEASWLVWDDSCYIDRRIWMTKKPDAGQMFVLDMHNKSGLWKDIQSRLHRNGGANMIPSQVSLEATNWLESHGVGKDDPMVGSSVQFDRLMLTHQMPDVAELFSYRNIDISTIKELCKRYNPLAYADLDNVYQAQKLHRVIPDLVDSIAEFQFYKEEFLWLTK